MAIPNMPSQDGFVSRLSSLVRRARTVKKETSIDPPLQISALLEDNEPLVERIEPRDLRELTAESAAKSILYPKLVGVLPCYETPKLMSSRALFPSTTLLLSMCGICSTLSKAVQTEVS